MYLVCFVVKLRSRFFRVFRVFRGQSQHEIRRGDQNDKFAFHATLEQTVAHVGGAADVEGFVEFGDFLRDADDAVGPERLAGVLLYGIARPSMQVEAPRLSPLTERELEAIADEIRKKGLTVRVSP